MVGRHGGISQLANDFNRQLTWSEAASGEPFWDAVYRKAFPDLVNHMQCKGDTTSQRLGIDRAIHLSSGKTLYVDEKKRDKDYGDMLLEYISVDRTGAPGWIEKDLQIDYLAYAIMPTHRCYLFPWAMLRRAWLYYKDAWLADPKKYRRIEAQNVGYKTLSIAVPLKELRTAVYTAAMIDVSSELNDGEWN